MEKQAAHQSLTTELERFGQIITLAFYLAIFALFCRLFVYGEWGTTALIFGLYLLFFQLSIRSIKRLYYSSWTFLFFFLFLLLYYFFSHVEIINLPTLFAAIMLILALYELSSPLYFPRVPWWEYDFRYRSDLSVLIDGTYPGRLTDLRRFAGGLVSFQHFDIQQKIQLKVESKDEIIIATVLAKREILVGRGLVYGIKFSKQSSKEKQNYLLLAREWKKRHKKKWEEKRKSNKRKNS